MKQVNFYSEDIRVQLLHPKPASRFLPEWFKKLPGVSKGTETIKKCMPFLDAMTSGYMLVLAADVSFDGKEFEEISKIPMVSKHLSEQIEGINIPDEYNKQPFKWNNLFAMKTPRGYSTMFLHPLNRIELPFYSISGVVDTDSFPVAVNFPFFVKKDFRGVIPAGTPIAQAIPFKRTVWKHKVHDDKPIEIPINFFNRLNPPFNFYKRNYWQKKTYQ